MDFMKKALNQLELTEDTLYDIIYNLIFFAELKESEDDMKSGRIYTLEEVEAEMEAKYESYNDSKSQE